MATQVIRYVDPDATGAGNGTSWTNAYTSLQTAQSTEAKDLTSADQYYLFNCRSSGGTADTTAVQFGGWSGQDATHYVEIIGTDFPADGVYDNTAYRIEVTNAHVLDVNRDGRIYFRNLQIQLTASSGTYYGIYMWGASVAPYWIIDSCIIKGVCSGTGSAYGARLWNGGASADVYNTVIYDFVSGADNGFGCFQNASGTLNLYNCTFYNAYFGLSTSSNTTNLYNCAIGNCTDDISGSGASADYCCTDDSDGSNGQNPSGGDWANEFTDAANGDFSLVAGGNCIENGTNNPGSGLYSDDIIGTTRS